MLGGHYLAGFALGILALASASTASAQNLELISRQDVADGGTQANGRSDRTSISADGRYVVFDSQATNLIPGGGTDINGSANDVFLFDRQTGGLELISRQGASDGGAQGNNNSSEPSISADGRLVAFRSQATNLIPGGGTDANGLQADVFVLDRQTGRLELVSRQDAGDGGAQANDFSVDPLISADGRYVAFASQATNLIPGGGTDANGGNRDIFVFDRQTGSLELISRQDAADGGAQANNDSFDASISANGRYVAFRSDATNLIPGGGPDANGFTHDVFVFDRQTGDLELISRQDVGDGGAQGNGRSLLPSISADGRYVAFDSQSTNLIPGGGPDNNGPATDVFLFDRQTNGLELISRQDAADGGAQGNNGSVESAISAGGRYVTFRSDATNLIPGGGPDANNSADIFVFDRQTGKLKLASRQGDADGGVQGNMTALKPSISADGRFVGFSSLATNLIPGGGTDANGTDWDVFVFGPLILRDNDLAADFGATDGLWARFDDSTWAKMNSQSPQVLATGDLDDSGKDEVIASFGSGAGLWAFRNNSAWVNLNSQAAEDLETGNLDLDASDEVIADFGAGVGLWAFYNDSTWTKINSQSPNEIATGDIDNNGQDEVIASFGVGLWAFRNNSVWAQLDGRSAGDLETGDLDSDARDEVIADFGPGVGLWALYNDGTWTELNSRSPEVITVADLDGNGIDEVVAAFGGGFGLWVWRNNTAWEKLNSQTPEDLATADLDSSGQQDLVVDFGAGGGLWAYVNDSTWTAINSQSSELIAAGNFDGK